MSGLTAEQLLAIPVEEPERLFPNDEAEANKAFKALALLWHPDRNREPRAAAVMAHLSALYAAVVEKIKAGIWAAPGTYAFSGDGKTRTLRYVARHDFEFGELLVGSKLASYVVFNAHTDHMLQGLRAIGSIRYPDKKWRADMEQFFPRIEKVMKDVTHGADVISMHKEDDAIVLADLLTYVKGALDPKHTAWIVSSLLNLCCFFQVAGITHNGLSTQTVFVSPKRHAVYILGGWWFSVPAGGKLKFVPRTTHALMTNRERTMKVASPRIDLECVREIARKCIGPDLKGLPKPYVEYLRGSANSDPIKEYEGWGKVLRDSFGARRFIKLDISPSVIYGGL